MASSPKLSQKHQLHVHVHHHHHQLKLVTRSREHIPPERRGSLPASHNIAKDHHQQFLISYASAASMLDVVPVLDLPAPPDGGWGWVIVFASFMCNLILDGIAYSFGVFLVPLMEEFEVNRSTISWVGSLLAGLYQSSGPIVGGLVNKFGCRSVCISGGIISCLALLLSSLTQSATFLMLTYGVIGGFGLGMIYLPSVIVCGYYFERRRALATGIAVCGSGAGCFVFAPFAVQLLEEYGWRGSYIIFAGLCLNCCVFGALMRPLQLVVKGPSCHGNSIDNMEMFEDFPPPITAQQELGLRKNFSDPQMNSQTAEGHGKPFLKRGSHAGPGALGLPRIPSLLLTPCQSLTLLAEEIKEEPEEDDERFEASSPPTLIISGTEGNTNKLEIRRQTISDVTIGSIPMKRIQRQPSGIRRNYSTPGLGKLTKITGLGGPPEAEKEHVIFAVNDGDHIELQPSRRGSQATVRPLSRKDIFYGGSILHLIDPDTAPTSQALARYRHSVISIPSYHGQNPLPRGSVVASHLAIKKEAIDPEVRLLSLESGVANSLVRVFKEMIDLHLFKNVLFLLICLSNILGFLALYVPYVYLPNMMAMKNISLNKASFAVSAIGISNTLGRVLIGWIVDFPQISSLLITNLSLFSSGMCLFFIPFCETYTAFLIVALCLGLSVSAFISLTSIVLVDLLGLDVLTSAFGLLVSFRGVASILGPPLAGSVYELSDDYNASFYLAGGMFIAASLVSQLAWHLRDRAIKT